MCGIFRIYTILGRYGGTQHLSGHGRGGTPMYVHSGASSNFQERSSRDGRSGRQRDYGLTRYDDFKDPDPGVWH